MLATYVVLRNAENAERRRHFEWNGRNGASVRIGLRNGNMDKGIYQGEARLRAKKSCKAWVEWGRGWRFPSYFHKNSFVGPCLFSLKSFIDAQEFIAISSLRL